MLITGGAGFIGSYVADELLAHGYRVRALDALTPQVHGDERRPPPYLDARVELVVGDVRDRAALSRALDDVDAVLHLAAAVGVGQSMYQIAEYTSVNTYGTAMLLELLSERPARRLVVASSMSVYGEGLYRDEHGQLHDDVERSAAQLERGDWEPRSRDGLALRPVPTPEHKRPALASVYALTKFDQERMSLVVGGAYRIPTVALRLFNVYGPRQALSNPYTGVLANFAARFLNGRSPLIFEDGEQRRDFVHVRDVARACRLALETEAAAGRVFNIASGQAITINEIARRMAALMGSRPGAEITRQCRLGDIRHCTADIELARQVLGYQPQVAFDDGLTELVAWLQTQLATDRSETMRRELAQRGLTV